MAGLGRKTIERARVRLLADPEIRSHLDAAPAFNTFYSAAIPVFEESERIREAIDKLIVDINGHSVSRATIRQSLDRLTTESTALRDQVPAIPARNNELEAIRDRLGSAQSHQIRMLKSLSRFLETGDQSEISGPAGLNDSATAYEKDLTATGSLRDAYIKAHNLRIVPSTASP